MGVLARHLGVGIHSHRLLEEVEHKADENRRLYDGLRTIYKETVHAFAAAIDIKDRYTQGHSVRVGDQLSRAFQCQGVERNESPPGRGIRNPLAD